MRKKRKMQKHVLEQRKRKALRERVRISNVAGGLGADLNIKEIHHKTGLTQKNIRKIMFENAEEITFLILATQRKGTNNG